MAAAVENAGTVTLPAAVETSTKVVASILIAPAAGADPNPVPATVTLVPTGPDAGATLVIVGAAVVVVTVNTTPLLATPPTVTVTLPVVAPVGTGATIRVADQLVGVAVVPANFTTLVPCVAPK